jgi:hypothetical protein
MTSFCSPSRTRQTDIIDDSRNNIPDSILKYFCLPAVRNNNEKIIGITINKRIGVYILASS